MLLLGTEVADKKGLRFIDDHLESSEMARSPEPEETDNGDYRQRSGGNTGQGWNLPDGGGIGRGYGKRHDCLR